MTTFAAAVAEGRRRVAGASESPWLDSLLLLSHASGKSKESVLASSNEQLSDTEYERFCALVDERRTGVPVAYLLGHKEFYGETYRVDRRVLIPRPDTETLVEAVVSIGPFRRILDLGTGSGCIAISLAKRFPGSAVFASDVSAPALAVCRENSRAVLGRELPTFESDIFDRVEGRFDCIVSNPPYLTVPEWNERRAAGWVEPEGALVAGIDGLDVIRRIITGAVESLEPGGYLFIEAAPHQFDEIGTLYAAAGFHEVTIHRDLGGNDRAVSGRVV